MLVLIGGGDLKSKSTLEIDQFIIKESKKEKPNVLFIPTAANNEARALDNFLKSYEKCNVISLTSDLLSDCDKYLNWADIIYVNGGNTLKMLQAWEKYDLGKKIFNLSKNKIVCGMSAGAICWFSYYLSDINSFYDNGHCNFTVSQGLGFIKGYCCPHYDEDGKDIFNEVMRKTSLVGYAIENNVALVIDKDIKIIKSKKTNSCYRFNFNCFMEELKWNL